MAVCIARNVREHVGDRPSRKKARASHVFVCQRTDRAEQTYVSICYPVDVACGDDHAFRLHGVPSSIDCRNRDACHGRTSNVLWNGKEQDICHYDATLEYPYTIGCFHGTPITTGTPGM